MVKRCLSASIGWGKTPPPIGQMKHTPLVLLYVLTIYEAIQGQGQSGSQVFFRRGGGYRINTAFTIRLVIYCLALSTCAKQRCHKYANHSSKGVNHPHNLFSDSLD